ncbi:unnamed protein product [Urochloa humidicola]
MQGGPRRRRAAAAAMRQKAAPLASTSDARAHSSAARIATTRNSRIMAAAGHCPGLLCCYSEKASAEAVETMRFPKRESSGEEDGRDFSPGDDWLVAS